jgi:hypothetical protein
MLYWIKILGCGKGQHNYDHAQYDAKNNRGFHSHSPFVKKPIRRSNEMNERKNEDTNQRQSSWKN